MFGEKSNRPVLIVGSTSHYRHLAMLCMLTHMAHSKIYCTTPMNMNFHPELKLPALKEFNGIEQFQQNKINLIPVIADKPYFPSPLERLLNNQKEPFSIVTIKNTFPSFPKEYRHV